MNILVQEKIDRVQAIGVRFIDEFLILELSDRRQVWLPLYEIRWLGWLAQATPEQRANWEILPQGIGVYWENLDDGFEVEHALSMERLD